MELVAKSGDRYLWEGLDVWVLDSEGIEYDVLEAPATLDALRELVEWHQAEADRWGWRREAY